MMLRLFLVLAVFFFGTARSQAFFKAPAFSFGKAALNLGSGDLGPGDFINIMKAGRLTVNSSTGDVGKLDAEGYLTSTPSANMGIAFPSSTGAAPAFTGVQYKLVIPPGTQVGGLLITSTIAASSCVSAINITFTGCTGGNTTFATIGSSGGSIIFTNSAAQPVMAFTNTGTYTHTLGTEIAIYRLSDETSYQAGQYFTPEFISVLQVLKPATIRPMGWVNKASSNLNAETQWRYRVNPTSLCWRNGEGNVPPGAWGGTISGTDTYTINPAPDSPTNWTDGEVIIGVTANTNTSTVPTLQIGTRTTKTIVKSGGSAMTAGFIVANQLATFVYDGVLDEVLYVSAPGNATNTSGGGIFGSVPIEAQIQLANTIGANLWATIPAMANDDYVTNWATVVLNNLQGYLFFYPEYTNELWNFSFPQTAWAAARGLALGFPNANSEPSHGWYGLRVRQIMGNLIPAVWSSRMGQLRRVLMWQGGGNLSQISTYRLKGNDLAPLGTGTGQGNALYDSYTGSANYTTKPNRPVDVVEVGGFAPYVTGNNLCFGPDQGNGCTLNSNMTPFYQALVTAWEAGQSTTAIAMVDNDVRQGQQLIQTVTAVGTLFTTPLAHGFTANSTNIAFTVSGGTSYSGLASGLMYRVLTTPTSTTFTAAPWANGAPGVTAVNSGTAGTGTVSVGSTPFTSMLWMANTWYPLWESMLASFDSDRPSGAAALRGELYEGNLEPQGLTTAQCATLGITSSQDCGTDIANAVAAWKLDASAALTTTAYFNQFMGLDPAMAATYGLMAHSKTPNWLVLQCSVTYQLLNGCGPTSSPLQLYNGFKSFSINFLLKRDIDPASNDNDPMWLSKAA